MPKIDSLGGNKLSSKAFDSSRKRVATVPTQSQNVQPVINSSNTITNNSGVLAMPSIRQNNKALTPTPATSSNRPADAAGQIPAMIALLAVAAYGSYKIYKKLYPGSKVKEDKYSSEQSALQNDIESQSNGRLEDFFMMTLPNQRNQLAYSVLRRANYQDGITLPETIIEPIVDAVQSRTISVWDEKRWETILANKEGQRGKLNEAYVAESNKQYAQQQKLDDIYNTTAYPRNPNYLDMTSNPMKKGAKSKKTSEPNKNELETIPANKEGQRGKLTEDYVAESNKAVKRQKMLDRIDNKKNKQVKTSEPSKLSDAQREEIIKELLKQEEREKADKEVKSKKSKPSAGKKAKNKKIDFPLNYNDAYPEQNSLFFGSSKDASGPVFRKQKMIKNPFISLDEIYKVSGENITGKEFSIKGDKLLQSYRNALEGFIKSDKDQVKDKFKDKFQECKEFAQKLNPIDQKIFWDKFSSIENEVILGSQLSVDEKNKLNKFYEQSGNKFKVFGQQFNPRETEIGTVVRTEESPLSSMDKTFLIKNQAAKQPMIFILLLKVINNISHLRMMVKLHIENLLKNQLMFQK
jgi:hypothetical protein